ncbi:MAG: DNA gyrase inhibitor YacG [Acidobacteria bacterium]|nr:DNA gyrase inhibitor YacG [Acidobacteriota bacterium]
MRPCPICRQPADPKEKHFPFCSPRCKTIDLGAWAAEEYVVSRPLNESDEAFQTGEGSLEKADE